MSRFLTKIENDETIIEIESMEVCKWKINEVCCNDKCEYLGDYPLREICYIDIKDRCEYFEKEDGIIN